MDPLIKDRIEQIEESLDKINSSMNKDFDICKEECLEIIKILDELHDIFEEQ